VAAVCPVAATGLDRPHRSSVPYAMPWPAVCQKGPRAAAGPLGGCRAAVMAILPRAAATAVVRCLPADAAR
jgi:hypothetical protein